MHSTTTPLVTRGEIQSLLKQTSDYVDYLSVTTGGVIKGFFDIVTEKFREEKQKLADRLRGHDFSQYHDIQKLRQIRDYLSDYRAKTSHKYKRLHYTFIISLIDDRILELERFEGKTLDRLTKFNHAVQPGDIMMISKEAKQLRGIKKKLDKIIDGALKYFSGSIYMHIGMIGKGNPDQGYDRIHSTLYASQTAKPGVQKASLTEYLIHHKPEDVLVVRYQDMNPEFLEKLMFLADYHVKRNSHYDTADALGDITGMKRWRDPKKYNCGEFVYDCLYAIDPSFEIEKRSLPGQYSSHKKLQQVYLRRFIEY